MSSINFDNVYLLFLIIPLVAVFTVPFLFVVRKENRNGHNIASMALHVVMAALIAFAVAGTNIVTVITQTEVYVVADVSYSAQKNLDTIDNYITNVRSGLPRNSQLGIVCFGKDYEILTEMGGAIKSVKDSSVDESETNIAEALEYTGTLFGDDTIKRIVLITDGKQSDQRDVNSLKRAVDNLESKNVIVDAIYLDDNPAEDAQEVQVISAEFTRTTYLNHAEKVSVSVQSTFAARYKASLYCGGELVGTPKNDILSIGFNVLTFDLITDEEGAYDYEFVIEAEGDREQYNNNYKFTQNVTGAISLLIVSDSKSDVEILEAKYAEHAAIDSYVNDTANPNTTDIPYTIEQICQYDEIILVNTDVSKIKNYEMFINSVDTAVSVFGKSLITIGDTRIQYLEDEEAEVDSGIVALKKLQDMLPVRYGNDKSDPRLLTLVIDCSHSMRLNNKLLIAKRAATYIVSNLLNDDDEICIIGFFGEVRMIQTPVALSDRDSVLEKIQNITTNQGTIIGAGLREAYKVIRTLPYSNKQVMLMSDGVNFMAEDSEFEPLNETAKLLSYGIRTSVLDVGRGVESDNAPALTLMKDIAITGKGVYYYAANNLSVLDKTIFGEMATDQTEDIVKTNSWVRANKRFDGVLEGIDATQENVSYISQFVYATAEGSATTVLTVDYINNEQTISAPLYTYWKYGVGRVAVFTSGLDSEWLGMWSNLGYDDILLNNILQTNVPNEKIDYPFLTEVTQEGKYARIEVTPSTVHYDASATASVTLPDGEEITGVFTFDSAIYYFEFELPSVGSYSYSVTYTYDNNEYAASGSLYVPYTAEYDAFATYDPSPLYTMMGKGSVSEDGKISIVNDDSEVGLYTIELTAPLLVICAVLWVVDIAVRKLKWADIKSLFNLGHVGGKGEKK